MKIQLIKTGQVYETTQEEWINSIESKGNGYKFKIIEGDVPIEVKTIRQKKVEVQEEIIVKKKSINKK